MWLKSFFSLLCFFQFLWKFAAPSFRCQVHQDMLVPNSTVIQNRTKVLHLMGIQELKRVKSDNRDMNNLHSLNRSRSGFLNCVSCRKGKWEKCQSPSSLHSFGRGIAESGQSLSCTSTTGVRALLLLQAALAEQLGVHLEPGRSEHEALSAQLLCATALSCALVFIRALDGTGYSHSCDFFKAWAGSWSQHNQFLLCRWPQQHTENRQHI